MEIRFNKGLIITEGNDKLFVDSETTHVPIKHSIVVTHSHSDHSAGLKSQNDAYCTVGTERLFSSVNKKSVRNNHLVEFYDPFEINGFEIELIPAGHLLGAAQVIIRRKGQTILFSGDFCPEDLLCVNKSVLPNEDIDVLITETTYGNPSLEFKSRSDIRMGLIQWVVQKLSSNFLPIINVAHMGGAQEIIKLINNLSDTPIYVHPKIQTVSAIYQSEGIDLNFLPLESFDPNNSTDQPIILLPRGEKQVPKEMQLIPHSRAIVTGQSSRFPFRSFEFSAPLSTHANFSELIQTVKQIDPSYLLTHYSYDDKFADYVNQYLQYVAKPLKSCTDDPIDLYNLNSRNKTFDQKSILDYL